jgi:hypothetical protein
MELVEIPGVALTSLLGEARAKLVVLVLSRPF